MHRCGAILQPTSNSIIARRVYSMPHPSLTRDLPREIDGERWLFSLPPSSPRRPLHASIRSSVLEEIEREIEGKVALLGGDGLPSTRPEKRKTLVGRKVFGRVMNLQIPWNGACYSLVAAVASARNRTPISLSLSVLDFQRSLPHSSSRSVA